MNVPSYEFLAFATVVAIALNLSTARRYRRAALLVANLIFLGTFVSTPLQLGPYAGLLALGYVAMRLLETNKRKALFGSLVAALLISFFWIKRYTFVPHQVVLSYAYVSVGMSYVFFRILHLVIDSFQDALPRRVDILSYCNFTLNFTSLVSGPIQLFGDYERTEADPLRLDGAAIGSAAARIIVGFFKVSIVSPTLLYVHERCTAMVLGGSGYEPGILSAATALAVYPFYIYFNFSGYMDVVIGVARFFRSELPENFDRPFYSESFIEFWGRWHMTLSNWMKTYVYSPLLINLMRRFRSPKAEAVLGVSAYFVTFFLIGAWHGQTTVFLFYGVLLGLGVSVNKLFQITMIRSLGRTAYRTLCVDPIYAALSRGLTFLYFAFTLLWFWSSWGQLERFASVLGPASLMAAAGLVLVASALLLSLGKAIDRKLADLDLGGRLFPFSVYARTAWLTALVVIIVSVTVVLKAPAAHVIYRAF